MATRSSAHETVSELKSDERTSVVASAKMHMHILRAQLLFLRETGSVPKEIEELLSELMATFPERPTVDTQLQTKLPTPTHENLNPPREISIKTGYLCGNHHHIVANSGDRVIVFAWTNNRTEAIAYNLRNQTAGRIPVNFLGNEDSKPFTDTKLYMSTSDQRAIYPGHAKWKLGDYLRVWDRENKRNAMCDGFCFNITTGGIGKFVTSTSVLKLID